jgi:hypothetical protein
VTHRMSQVTTSVWQCIECGYNACHVYALTTSQTEEPTVTHTFETMAKHANYITTSQATWTLTWYAVYGCECCEIVVEGHDNASDAIMEALYRAAKYHD